MYEQRTLQLFLDDMGNAIHRVLDFIQDMSDEEFSKLGVDKFL